jgi:uncharacterized RDD family membrane protein YckC
MNDDPYRAPQADLQPPARTSPHSSAERDVADGISTDNTIMPRYLAASIDAPLAIVVSLVAARSLGEDSSTLQVVALVAAYLGYFFFCEGFASRTPGKFIAGLVVVQTNGQPCTWWQVFIRTGFRFLEVNPIFLGGLPAALCIVFSKRHQRFGDKLGRTLVVPPRRAARYRASEMAQAASLSS